MRASKIVASSSLAISARVGGAPVRGMADRLLPAVGAETSARGVARLYAGLVDAFVLDTVDKEQATDVALLGMDALVTRTLMTTTEDAVALAATALEAL